MIALNVIQTLAAVYVLGEGLLALNRMGPATSHSVRLAYLVITSGALAAITSALGGHRNWQLILVLGVAIYFAVDRRRRNRSTT